MKKILFLMAWLIPAAALAKTQGPVAVLPFRNLNQDADLEWLSAGISETMISDIRKTGGLAVVERDQVSQVLSELALQKTKATDVTTAAQVGRIVGAKTIVVGGFQKAGKQVRITARFVDVQTGIVQDTAKVTGSLETIFSLQDQIVTRLTGRTVPTSPPKGKRPKKGTPARVPRPKATRTTVKAYKLYALSLTAVSDAKRTELLQASLEVDPSFVYAKDDLTRLEQRMRQLYERSQSRFTDRERKLWAAMESEDAPDHERMSSAMQLHVHYITNGHYRADIALAEKVYAMRWGTAQQENMRSNALMWMVQGFDQLAEYDQALQVGEQFLEEFGGTMIRNAVEWQIKAIISKKLDREKARKSANAAMEKLDQEAAELRAKDADLIRLASVDFQRCSTSLNHHQYLRADRICADFVREYRKHIGKHQAFAQWIQVARLHRCNANKSAGRFTEAQELAKKLIAEEPDFARQMHLDMQIRAWPKD